MLSEYKKTKQIPGEPRRRWLSDDYFDLVFWQNENGQIIKFELCYNKTYDEHALVWDKKDGYVHYKVDNGERDPGKHKKTPVFISDGFFDSEIIAEKFLKACMNVDSDIKSLIYKKILEYSI